MTIKSWYDTHILVRIAEGRLGNALDEDASEASGAICSETITLDGICAAEGAKYWSWDGVVEYRPHGLIRMIGIRSEHDEDGVAIAGYPYNREHWVR